MEIVLKPFQLLQRAFRHLTATANRLEERLKSLKRLMYYLQNQLEPRRRLLARSNRRRPTRVELVRFVRSKKQTVLGMKSKDNDPGT